MHDKRLVNSCKKSLAVTGVGMGVAYGIQRYISSNILGSLSRQISVHNPFKTHSHKMGLWHAAAVNCCSAENGKI